MVFSRSENCRTSVLYFTLYVRLLHDAGCIIACCVSGFHVPECYVYNSQAGRYAVMSVWRKRIAEKLYTSLCLNSFHAFDSFGQDSF